MSEGVLASEGYVNHERHKHATRGCFAPILQERQQLARPMALEAPGYWTRRKLRALLEGTTPNIALQLYVASVFVTEEKITGKRSPPFGSSGTLMYACTAALRLFFSADFDLWVRYDCHNNSVITTR